jgi:hypothetical protein
MIHYKLQRIIEKESADNSDWNNSGGLFELSMMFLGRIINTLQTNDLTHIFFIQIVCQKLVK